MKNIIAILSVLISANAFGQIFEHSANSRVQAGVGYWGENTNSASKSTKAPQDNISSVAITGKVEYHSGSFYRVSGRVTYLNNGQQVEQLFDDVGIFIDAHGKFVEGSEDGPYATYLYIKKNDKDQTVLFARVYDTSKLPDEHVATSANGVGLPAPEPVNPEHQPSQFTMFKM
ncbi:MAG: hypothetical protein R2877_06850 [Bdellovibrionota bacterium]